MITREGYLHQQVCDYLRLQYPRIVFRTDHSAGIKMSMHQAVRHKRLQSSRAYPDIFIAEPRGIYHGLFLELKATPIHKKNGELLKNEHLLEQHLMLVLLSSKGYKAEFGVGFEATKDIIDKYMNNGAKVEQAVHPF